MAYKHLAKILPDELFTAFPTTKQLLHFEGINGPDGIKIKTPAQGEPWHFYNPFDKNDTQILDLMRANYRNLVRALKEGNVTRAAFEASWLAHAIVDGLTPAHHYPYEEELIRLRGGSGIDERTSYKSKLLMPGDTIVERVKHNWEMLGDKGLLSTHMAFEFGVAVLIVPMRRGTKREFNAAELHLAETKDGFIKYFQRRAEEVAELELYQKFYQVGWTPKTVKVVRSQLVPILVETITFAWYAALAEANR